ncbi:hypothetical protein SAMN05216268_11313 [Streptomyces yunnanensis]|uniref:Uncharacterized protein n=1 Tax=Streptomyces yunnanensis TaxID=156453 RepID=A0A9X8N1T1_9ACTN|nr:hypothetical protein SAMN05216268_11313 [Streptomyces yunnanensis]
MRVKNLNFRAGSVLLGLRPRRLARVGLPFGGLLRVRAGSWWYEP